MSSRGVGHEMASFTALCVQRRAHFLGPLPCAARSGRAQALVWPSKPSQHPPLPQGCRECGLPSCEPAGRAHSVCGYRLPPCLRAALGLGWEARLGGVRSGDSSHKQVPARRWTNAPSHMLCDGEPRQTRPLKAPPAPSWATETPVCTLPLPKV